MAYPLSVGCKLVFADVDPITLNMDPADVARKITPRTRMIVPVHIGGYPVDMDPIMELARKHDILVLEDAAHAFGAVYHGRSWAPSATSAPSASMRSKTSPPSARAACW